MSARDGSERGERRKALLFLGGLGLAAIGAAVFGTRVLGLFTGPDVAIVSALKATQAQTLTLPLPLEGAPPLVVHRHFFERILVQADLEARRAEVTATLDAEGKVGGTQVSSLGVERVPFRYEAGAWEPSEGFAPRLSGVLALLEARRRALEAADGEALRRLSRPDALDEADGETLGLLEGLRDRTVQAEAWYLRLEREEVVVREELRIRGDGRDRPVDERKTRRLRVRDAGGEFFFGPELG